MKKLGNDIFAEIGRLMGDDEQAKINFRARQVRERYKAALESVYRDQAPLFLAHTNNVYVMKKRDVKTLIVYVDESIFSAELNAQRELIKLKLLELFGEQIEEFEIYVSREKYKKNHPYLTDDRPESDEKHPPVQLDSNEKAYVSTVSATVEDERLREKLKKAMTADMEWKKGESGKLTQETEK